MKSIVFISAAITGAAFFIGLIYKENEASKELILITTISYLIAVAFLGLFVIRNDKLFERYVLKRDKNALREIVFGKSKNQSPKG